MLVNFNKWLVGCLGFILLAILSVIIYAGIGCWLWNLIMVPVFALPALHYWQMYGIMILARMIFGRDYSSSSND